MWKGWLAGFISTTGKEQFYGRKTQKKIERIFLVVVLIAKMNTTDEPETYPDNYVDWVLALSTKDLIRSMWIRMSMEERKEFLEAEEQEEEDVDDYEAPNTYPYKKCCECGDRKSCGSYKEQDWYCEDCYEEEDENCSTQNLQ